MYPEGLTRPNHPYAKPSQQVAIPSQTRSSSTNQHVRAAQPYGATRSTGTSSHDIQDALKQRANHRYPSLMEQQQGTASISGTLRPTKGHPALTGRMVRPPSFESRHPISSSSTKPIQAERIEQFQSSSVGFASYPPSPVPVPSQTRRFKEIPTYRVEPLSAPEQQVRGDQRRSLPGFGAGQETHREFRRAQSVDVPRKKDEHHVASILADLQTMRNSTLTAQTLPEVDRGHRATASEPPHGKGAESPVSPAFTEADDAWFGETDQPVDAKSAPATWISYTGRKPPENPLKRKVEVASLDLGFTRPPSNTLAKRKRSSSIGTSDTRNNLSESEEGEKL